VRRDKVVLLKHKFSLLKAADKLIKTNISGVPMTATMSRILKGVPLTEKIPGQHSVVWIAYKIKLKVFDEHLFRQILLY
jgi:hypothetical protein